MMSVLIGCYGIENIGSSWGIRLTSLDAVYREGISSFPSPFTILRADVSFFLWSLSVESYAPTNCKHVNSPSTICFRTEGGCRKDCLFCASRATLLRRSLFLPSFVNCTGRPPANTRLIFLSPPACLPACLPAYPIHQRRPAPSVRGYPPNPDGRVHGMEASAGRAEARSG